MAYPRNKIDVNGHEWSFIKLGSGTPLLLLHGIINYADFYLPAADLLKDKYELIIPDLPSFGFTSKIDKGNTYANMADELYYFLKLIGYQSINIFGTSMGGVIGLELSRSHPEIVENIIIHATPWKRNGINLNSFEKFLIHSLLYHLPFSATDLFKKYIFIKLLPTVTNFERKDVQEMLKVYGERIVESFNLLDPHGTIEVFRSLEQTKLDELLKLTPVNATVIAGDEDAYVSPEEEKELAERIGAKNYEILHGVDHSFILDNPTKLAEIIKSHIQ
jgi:pimeloyl-ACP methyl ester carboxylesterase